MAENLNTHETAPADDVDGHRLLITDELADDDVEGHVQPRGDLDVER